MNMQSNSLPHYTQGEIIKLLAVLTANVILHDGGAHDERPYYRREDGEKAFAPCAAHVWRGWRGDSRYAGTLPVCSVVEFRLWLEHVKADRGWFMLPAFDPQGREDRSRTRVAVWKSPFWVIRPVAAGLETQAAA